MIILESPEIEKALFENKEEALVPLEITRRDNEVEIVTFERTLELAKILERDFISHPFEKESVEFIHANLEPIVNSWGYFVDDISEGHILTYVLGDLKKSLILPNTFMVKSSDGYKNLTDYELEEIPSDSDECYFVTVDDGKIVSVCEMNTEGVFIGATEINVYTNPSYRGMGYGASNVSAMCEYLTSKGHRVAYTTKKDNVASSTLAKKCGFKQIAETYYYICYRND